MNSMPLNSMTNEAVLLLPEQEQQASVIAHLALYSDMLIAVTGPIGSGKSTLAFELLRQHNNIENTLLITADIMFGIPSLLRRIGDVDQISLPENRGQAIDMLKQAAEQRASTDNTLLVVIDQAEQLDIDTLNEIAHLALLIPRGLSLVLFGTSGFEQNFRQGPAQAAIHVENISPLNEESAHKLLQNIYSPNQPLPLNETEFIYIYRNSGGYPGALILQAGEYFLSATAGSPQKKRLTSFNFGERFPVMHVVALVLLASALLLSYFYQPQETTDPLEDTAAPLEDVLRGLPLPDKQELSPFVEETRLQVAEVATLQNNEPGYNYREPVTAAPVVTGPPNVAPKKIEPEASKPKLQPAQPIVQNDVQKLLAVKQGAVVQLFGSYSQTSATKFKKQWQSTVNTTLYQYQTTNNGKPWHVIVVGVYADKTEAQQAIQQWPAKLKAEKPWVRDISAVQQGLR